MVLNIAVLVGLLILAMVLLRQVPVLGLLIRLVTRTALVVSPLVIVVVLVAVAWFHGSALLSVSSEPASRALPPAAAPLPPERPGD